MNPRYIVTKLQVKAHIVSIHRESTNDYNCIDFHLSVSMQEIMILPQVLYIQRQPSNY